MAKAVPKSKLERFIKTPEAMKNDPDFPIFQAGVVEGRRQMQIKALTFLEMEYLNDTIERGSVQGDAILALAKALSAHLKADDGNENSRL